MLLEKQKIIMESEAKIELFSKDLNILKNKIMLLEEDNTNKEKKIKELNDSLIEYNQKLKSAEELYKFNKKIKENNINEKIDNYELELNTMKNKVNELEIEKSKLILDNNILLNRLENINKEKDIEIKIIESLYQKQMENLNKTISELNNKLLESLKDNNINKTSDESISLTIENENKIKKLNEENNKYKKELEQINNEKEELKKISLDKDKIIEKLEVEIEKYDYENNNKDKNKDEKNLNELNNLKNENEELKKIFKTMTQGINEANEIYNEKLLAFNKQILFKNNKILEYKNKISVLKAKINELYEELNTLRGTSSVNNNSFFNASFINNSIINAKPNQKTTDKLSSNSLILNKNYSTINNRIDIQNNIINPTKKTLAFNTNIYNSKTVDRKDIKDNNLNKLNNIITVNVNNSKDNINIMKDNNTINNVKNETSIAQIKREILFPQTPQVNKEVFIPNINNEKIEIKNNANINNLQEFINKNKEEDKNRINFLKEYKDILDKFGNNLKPNINNN